jgi:hypothetical protein
VKNLIALMILLLAGCASAPGLRPDELESALRARAPQLGDEAVEAQPKGSGPARIAVSQPLSGPAWSAAEIAEITAWEKPLARAGVARQILVLPAGLSDECAPRADGSPTCSLQSQRQAAAIYGAERLLVLNPETRVEGHVNFLAPLDLTLVGLLIIPAHQRQGLTLVEGTLLDSRDDRVYAFARGEGVERTAKPWAYADQGEIEARSRLLALRDLGRELVEAARRHR